MSRVKAFPGRPTISGSTLPRTVHLDERITRSHQCLHFAFAKYSGFTLYTTNPGFAPHAYYPPPPSVPPYPTYHIHDESTQCTNCDYLVQPLRAALWNLRSPSGPCGSATTTTTTTTVALKLCKYELNADKTRLRCEDKCEVVFQLGASIIQEKIRCSKKRYVETSWYVEQI